MCIIIYFIPYRFQKHCTRCTSVRINRLYDIPFPWICNPRVLKLGFATPVIKAGHRPRYSVTVDGTSTVTDNLNQETTNYNN